MPNPLAQKIAKALAKATLLATKRFTSGYLDEWHIEYQTDEAAAMIAREIAPLMFDADELNTIRACVGNDKEFVSHLPNRDGARDRANAAYDKVLAKLDAIAQIGENDGK